MKNIFIAESAPLFLQGLVSTLSSLPNFKVKGHFSNRNGLLEGMEEGMPEVLLLDAQLDGLSFTRKKNYLWQDWPEVKTILMHTLSNPDPGLIKNYLSCGLKGFLLKTIGPSELISAINTVTEGDIFIQELLRCQLWRQSLGLSTKRKLCTQLTKREREVLQLIVEEKSTQEIADQLYIAFSTVETHRKNLILKLGVKNTAGLVREALCQQLYPIHFS
ncbi:MAG: response regulator transcription factor [Phaeodactylibacter sp.]|nr:response regulator transcription factor [Phaeodactylibacter sp.]MCB9049780.1 response regulator transcription factor [Lewinellaceae bacterium]